MSTGAYDIFFGCKKEAARSADGRLFSGNPRRTHWMAPKQPFEKLKKMSKSKNLKYTKWLKVFASHPDYDTRINHLKSRCEEDGFTRP